MTDSQPLCLLLTKTARLRLEPVPEEHLRDPSDLTAWLAAAGFGTLTADGDALRDAVGLREAIYRAARAVAEGGSPSTQDRDHLNAWSARNAAVRTLTGTGAVWRLPDPPGARDALAVIAADAVDTLGGTRDGTLKVCAGDRCVAVFLDASRGRSRRWCSMSTCGNRAKKSAMRDRQSRP